MSLLSKLPGFVPTKELFFVLQFAVWDMVKGKTRILRAKSQEGTEEEYHF